MTEEKTITEEVTKDSPLFKFESSNSSKIIPIMVLITVALVVLIYVCGILFSNPMLTILAFIIAIFCGVIIFAINSKIKKSNTNISEEEIEAAVEKYRNDLLDTFVGYDMKYTDEDIREATDKYRRSLLNGKTDNAELDANSISSIANAMIKDRKQSKVKKKENKQFLKEQKAYEKQNKKKKKQK